MATIPTNNTEHDESSELSTDMIIEAMTQLIHSSPAQLMIPMPPSIMETVGVVRGDRLFPPEFSASELTSIGTIGRASVTADEIPEPAPVVDEEAEAAASEKEKYLSTEYLHNICKVNGAFSYIVYLKDIYATLDFLKIPYDKVQRCPFCGQNISCIIVTPNDLTIRQSHDSSGKERKSFRRHGHIRLNITCSTCRASSGSTRVAANQIEDSTSAIPMTVARLPQPTIANYVSYIPVRGDDADILIKAFENLCNFNSGTVKVKSELVRLVTSEYFSIISGWNRRVDCKEIERQETEEELKVARKKLRDESKGIIKRPMSSD